MVTVVSSLTIASQASYQVAPTSKSRCEFNLRWDTTISQAMFRVIFPSPLKILQLWTSVSSNGAFIPLQSIYFASRHRIHVFHDNYPSYLSSYTSWFNWHHGFYRQTCCVTWNVFCVTWIWRPLTRNVCSSSKFETQLKSGVLKQDRVLNIHLCAPTYRVRSSRMTKFFGCFIQVVGFPTRVAIGTRLNLSAEYVRLD